MMKKEIRGQFTLFLFLENVNEATDLRGFLAVSGYEVFLFRDQETLLSRIQQAPPHLIIFEVGALQTVLSDFVQSILKLNSEIQFMPFASEIQLTALQEYREYNFLPPFLWGPEQENRCLWTVDRSCLELYFQYQNEQLVKSLSETKKKSEVLENQAVSLSEKNRELGQIEVFDVKKESHLYARAKSKEEILDLFLHHLEQKFLRRNKPLQALVLKFLPTVQSFVATQSLGVDLEKMKGVGARLEKSEAEDLLKFLEAGHCPQQLIHLLDQGLGVKDFVAKALFLPDSIECMLVFWSLSGPVRASEIENEFFVFQLIYQNLHLAKRLRETDTRDVVTELEGRDFYLKKLDEEMARARRLQKAVSIVKISIDHFVEIQQSFGVGNKNAVLRSVATLIKKSSRVNDYTCRTDENEISLLLPHCARKGAAIRAERIRRMIEGHLFNLSGHRVTVSCGISEYPSLCSSTENLEKTSQEALVFIQGKGGNKVCLYRAADNFKPDFDVPPL